LYCSSRLYTADETDRIQPDNSATNQRIQSLNFVRVRQSSDRSETKAMKTLRNIIGTVGLIYAGYVIITSMKDVQRYIRISSM
jgi:hypothetical protein